MTVTNIITDTKMDKAKR